MVNTASISFSLEAAAYGPDSVRVMCVSHNFSSALGVGYKRVSLGEVMSLSSRSCKANIDAQPLLLQMDMPVMCSCTHIFTLKV